MRPGSLRVSWLGLGVGSFALVAAGVTAASTTTGCSSSDQTGTIALVSGESDVLTQTPACTKLDVKLQQETDDGGLSGTPADLGSTVLPATSVNIGLSDISTDVSGFLSVTATDSTGAVRVRGTSVPVSVGALGNLTLDVFIQRAGEMSRLPGAFTVTHVAPATAIVGGQYIAVVDPTAANATIDLYDLLAWAPVTTATIARAASSLFSFGTVLAAVDATGATYLDLDDGTTGELTAPTGGTFADVAGGATVVDPNGNLYIVGGTRATGTASGKVLVIAPDGTGTFASLLTPRLGASAAFVAGRGLVVVAGSTTGAGAELLPSNATTATALPFPADATTGAGAATLDSTHLVLAGGTGRVRELDLGCGSNCTATPWKELKSPLTTAQAFPLDASSALVVGPDATHDTHAFVVTATASTEVPLRVPRQQARAITLPTQGIAIVGGAPTVESYIP